MQGISVTQHQTVTAMSGLTSKQYYELGLEYYRNNMTKTRECFEKAIQSNPNFGPALQKLGDIYEYGRGGVTTDLIKAVSYYRLSAANGDVCGIFCFGRCYELGRGVTKDLKIAAELYKLAYNQGYEGWKGYFCKFLSDNPDIKAYLDGQTQDKSKSNKVNNAVSADHKQAEEQSDEKIALLKKKTK